MTGLGKKNMRLLLAFFEDVNLDEISSEETNQISSVSHGPPARMQRKEWEHSCLEGGGIFG